MSSAMPRVLFFTADHEDYLSDGLMHGLRGLLGARLVDYPKAEFMYSSFPAERGPCPASAPCAQAATSRPPRAGRDQLRRI